MSNWKHYKMTNDEIKELVSNVYDGKIFTSLQCRGNIMSSFMTLLFIGAAPSYPTIIGDIKKDRKNKLQYMIDKEVYDKETTIREAYINNIGMCYEFIDKAGPMAINGMPIFFSCNIVSKEDSKLFCDMYNKYVKIREDFEKDWNKQEIS